MATSKQANIKRTCIECDQAISYKVYEYSMKIFGGPLCILHQDIVATFALGNTTSETLRLYYALKRRGIPAEIEKNDGYKTIDIAIPKAKINIEVDGPFHNTNHNQALIDLKRTYYSFLKGYFTFRIPNTLVNNHLEVTAIYLTKLIKQRMD